MQHGMTASPRTMEGHLDKAAPVGVGHEEVGCALCCICLAPGISLSAQGSQPPLQLLQGSVKGLVEALLHPPPSLIRLPPTEVAIHQRMHRSPILLLLLLLLLDGRVAG